ncbi:Ist2 protein [Maudiozyma humilis]|uniref:Ist2 protein n=1 Tax=Maudiozyma humilis TaxID=51915 RepID=A0AAV5S1A7_MAUHU|nr:Ist2 protein [Kazachstania humilis]
MKKYASLEELDPNCVVVYSNEHHSKRKLLGLLDAAAHECAADIHYRLEHGHTPQLDYAFLRIDDAQSLVFLETAISGLAFVHRVIPLYDARRAKQLNHLFDKTFNKSLSPRCLPSDADLRELAELTNYPKLALYFAFFRYYNRWLGGLGVAGALVYYFADEHSWEFSRLFTAVNVLWTIAFVTAWIYSKLGRYESLLGSFPSVYSMIGMPSAPDANMPAAGLLKNLLFLPVIVACTATLLAFQFACFILEIYIGQVYAGPAKALLGLAPTVLISVFVPVLTLLYNKYAVDAFVKLERPVDPAKSRLEKNFALKFCASYVPLLLTLFVYLPFSYLFTPQSKLALAEKYGLPVSATEYVVNTGRHQAQFFYFIVTNSVILFAMDNVVPVLLNRLTERLLTPAETRDHAAKIMAKMDRHGIRDLEIWSIARGYQVGAWGQFDADANFQKLVLQFGYVALFANVWPLAPLILFCVNVVVLKVDYWKATLTSQPKLIPGVAIPSTPTSRSARSDITRETASMGPWNGILRVIGWFGTFVGPTLCAMYRYCALPGVGLVTPLDNRADWHAHNPLYYHWSTMLLVAGAAEHVGIAVFFVLRARYTALAQPVVLGGFVPSLPGDITEKPMNTPSTTGEKAVVADVETIPDATKAKIDEYMEKTGELTQREIRRTDPEPAVPSAVATATATSTGVDTRASPRKSRALSISSSSSSESDAPGTSSTPQLLQQNSSALDLHKVSSVDLRAPIKDVSKLGSSSSEIAGATVPRTIPTSKNYDTRADSTEQEEAETEAEAAVAAVKSITGRSVASAERSAVYANGAVHRSGTKKSVRTAKPSGSAVAAAVASTNTARPRTPEPSDVPTPVKTPEQSPSAIVVTDATGKRTQKAEGKVAGAKDTAANNASLPQPPRVNHASHTADSNSSRTHSPAKDTQSNNSGARRQQQVRSSHKQAAANSTPRPKSMVVNAPGSPASSATANTSTATADSKKHKKRGLFGKLKHVL